MNEYQYQSHIKYMKSHVFQEYDSTNLDVKLGESKQ